MKTNAARLLDKLGISYQILTYEVDPADLAAESAAQKMSLSPEQVFKTLVVRGDTTGICFTVVPGNAQLDFNTVRIIILHLTCSFGKGERFEFPFYSFPFPLNRTVLNGVLPV